MENANEFMMIFRMPPIGLSASLEQIAAMHLQWKDFIGKLAAQGKLVNVSRLGFEGITLTNPSMNENNIYVEDNLTISGILMVRTVDIDEAKDIANRCPVLSMNGTVEIRPIISM